MSKALETNWYSVFSGEIGQYFIEFARPVLHDSPESAHGSDHVATARISPVTLSGNRSASGDLGGRGIRRMIRQPWLAS